MCLLLFSYLAHPRYPLIVAANRDEYYNRPSRQAAFYPDAPGVLAGRDLKEGGAWLGITREGRFAAVTNYRDPASYRQAARSRGLLVRGFLLGERTPAGYLEDVNGEAALYNRFNLVAGGWDGLFCLSPGGISKIPPGIHGLSNHLLNSPWPKVVRGKTALADLTVACDAIDPEDIFSLLASETQAEDKDLPATGVSLEWERVLSAAFIRSPGYGTRSSTVVLIGRDGAVEFLERTFTEEGRGYKESRYKFQIEKESK